MGEIAEAMLEGLFCAACGAVFDDMEQPGFPRYCDGCAEDIPDDEPERGPPKRRRRNTLQLKSRGHRHGHRR